MARTTESTILSPSRFMDRLRGEKRRSDRSKAPLSVVLFSFNKEEDHFHHITRFLPALHKDTRETDIIGWVDRDVIGLVLPDTNEKGVQSCIQKIANGNGTLPCSVSKGTYPDQIFEQLLSKEESQPDLFPLSLEGSTHSSEFQLILKRGIDIAGSIIGIILFSPLMIITALAIRVTSPGPIVFKQIRLGQKGVRFQFYKFRSMHWNTDDEIHRNYVSNLIEGNFEEINQGDKEEPLYKIRSDPRVTTVGRIIRKLSIDELPQFYNVLKGEMSLVGPRPPLPYEVEKYKAWHLRRILDAKPGITGLWQVNGRSKTSFDDMVRLDLKYAQNWSIGLDLKILLKTVKAVIRSSGAM